MAMPAALATSITVRIVPSVPALRWARALLAPRPLGGDPCQVRSTARIDSKYDRPSQIPLHEQGGADAYRAVWDSRADSRVHSRVAGRHDGRSLANGVSPLQEQPLCLSGAQGGEHTQ